MPLDRQSDGTPQRDGGVCRSCGRRLVIASGKRKRHGDDWLCTPCWKRLIWRPRGGKAVDNDREASRRWKRENLGQPGQPRRAA